MNSLQNRGRVCNSSPPGLITAYPGASLKLRRVRIGEVGQVTGDAANITQLDRIIVGNFVLVGEVVGFGIGSLCANGERLIKLNPSGVTIVGLMGETPVF